MAKKSQRTIDFYAGVTWRGEKFGEVFAGKEKQSRGLMNPPPVFGGIEGSFNAEEMLLASLALCKMSTFLHFVRENEIELVWFENDVKGTLTKGRNGFAFTHFVVDTKITVGKGNREKAEEATKLAERFCLISNSLNGEMEYKYNISEVE